MIPRNFWTELIAVVLGSLLLSVICITLLPRPYDLITIPLSLVWGAVADDVFVKINWRQS